MSLGLCIECGAYRAGSVARSSPCVRCGGAAPAWERVPLTLGGLARRVVVGAALVGGAVLLVGSAYVLCSRWLFPPGGARVLQVVLAAGMVAGGGLGAVGLLRQAVERLFQREHRHDQGEGDRRGQARALFGRVRQATGGATRDRGLFAPGTPALEALPVFVNMRVLAPDIGRALRAPQPKAVDIAVLAALLGLASRGRCELVLRVTHGWQRPTGSVLRRDAERYTLRVRPTARAGALPREDGWLENALLTALEAVSSTPPGRTPSPAGGRVAGSPYRSGAPAVRAPREGSMPIETLMGALTGGRHKARRWLHGVLRAQAAGAGALSHEAKVTAAARVGPELAAVLRLRRAGAGAGPVPAAALLAQVREGLALGGRGA